MYSHEIQRTLENYNYNLPASKYDEVCNPNNNPQISRLKYESFGNYFEMWTNDNHYWKFNIVRDFK